MNHLCPVVAEEMRQVMLDGEFDGWFERVWVAVRDPRSEGNLGVFREFLDSIQLAEKKGEQAIEVE